MGLDCLTQLRRISDSTFLINSHVRVPPLLVAVTQPKIRPPPPFSEPTAAFVFFFFFPLLSFFPFFGRSPAGLRKGSFCQFVPEGDTSPFSPVLVSYGFFVFYGPENFDNPLVIRDLFLIFVANIDRWFSSPPARVGDFLHPAALSPPPRHGFVTTPAVFSLSPAFAVAVHFLGALTLDAFPPFFTSLRERFFWFFFPRFSPPRTPARTRRSCRTFLHVLQWHGSPFLPNVNTTSPPPLVFSVS